MASLFGWIKRELGYLKDSLPEIIKGFILFFLAFSGFGAAILLRYIGYNGNVIALGGVLVEVTSFILCYFIFRKYLKTEEEKPPSDFKGKKKKGVN